MWLGGPAEADATGTADLAAVEALRTAGAQFRNDIVTGVGGKQILLDDPSYRLFCQ